MEGRKEDKRLGFLRNKVETVILNTRRAVGK